MAACGSGYGMVGGLSGELGGTASVMDVAGWLMPSVPPAGRTDVLEKWELFSQPTTRDQPYDLWVGDEAWELDYFLHENPELKTAAYAWLTDFVGWLPMADGAEHEAHLTADYNAEMIEHIARYPRLRDRTIFVGDADDIVPDHFGPTYPPSGTGPSSTTTSPATSPASTRPSSRTAARSATNWATSPTRPSAPSPSAAQASAAQEIGRSPEYHAVDPGGAARAAAAIAELL